MPGFVDCHTHLVYAGTRSHEYEKKTQGASYAKMHNLLGSVSGLKFTVEKTRKASEEELYDKAIKDLDKMLKHGTTTVEIKSGYGLSYESELKILKVIKKLSENHRISIITTFLGAHDIPIEFQEKREEYIEQVINMLPYISQNKLAKYCDVFCDALAFTPSETEKIFLEAKKQGFSLRVHSEQTSHTGATKMAVSLDVVTAEHLDYIDDEDITLLSNSKTIGVLLPGVTFHCCDLIQLSDSKDQQPKQGGISPFKVRKMIDNGVSVAIATDYNPGSCNTLSMKTIMECAARIYRMKTYEIINCVTINAAHALEVGDIVGSIEEGKFADIVIHDCEDPRYLIDNFGSNLVETVIKRGRVVVRNGIIEKF